jgi:pre-rRNA-processing protein IPI3
MYNAWDAHYRQITVLRFTRDGAALLSGSDDSGVNVWSVSRSIYMHISLCLHPHAHKPRLCDDGCQNDLAVPHCSLSDHTLPITDIICGAGSFPRCRVLTSSLDHSVKLWDLSTRSHPLLTTFQFPKPITCLAWDLCERFFFAASSDDEGSVHRMNLFRQRENGLVAEAVGGAGVGDVVRVGFDSQVEKTQEKKRLMLAG